MTRKLNQPSNHVSTHIVRHDINAINTSHIAKILIAILATIIMLSLVGCSKTNTDNHDTDNQANGTKPEAYLRILAGSELKDIEPLLPDIEANTGVQLQLDYTGTLDGVNAIAQGASADAAWFSHGKYLSLANQDKIKSQSSIMLSPVIMGVKHSKAQALGWLDGSGKVKSDITWQSIADAAQSGQLKYAMTNPSASNSGFTALMGVASAFAGTADAPTTEDIAIAKPKLKNFFRGQALTSGSSGWLADAYVNEQDELDAIINYESVLMQLNESGKLNEPLVMVYPKEGIVTADYPLTLLNFEKKESYDKVVDYLTSQKVQRRLMVDTKRRPVNNQVPLDSQFYSGLLVELPFPNSLRVIDELLIDFANELRNPAYSVFLLDTSGSMQGEGIRQLKHALLALTGENTDTNNTNNTLGNSGRFTQFAQNEVVGLKPFNHANYKMNIYPINTQNITKLRNDVNKLVPNGGTAIYSALLDSYGAIYSEQLKHQTANANNPDNNQAPFYYSIVLMTDGVSEDGISLNEFTQAYQAMPAEQQNIKTFVVLFGSADENEMQQIAELTGGRVFDGRNANLTDVFRKIRGYQ